MTGVKSTAPQSSRIVAVTGHVLLVGSGIGFVRRR